MVLVCEIIEDIWFIKDIFEIEIMKIVVMIVDEVFYYIVIFLKFGISEIDVWDELEFFMWKKGVIFFLF